MKTGTTQFVFIIFTTQMFHSVVCGMDCNYLHRFSKEMNRCVSCKDECKPGQRLTKNCGYDDEGTLVKRSCENCPAGTFSRYKIGADYRYCQICKNCKNGNREFKRNCTSEKNAVCGGCANGYYETEQGCKKKIIGLKSSTTKTIPRKLSSTSIPTTANRSTNTDDRSTNTGDRPATIGNRPTTTSNRPTAIDGRAIPNISDTKSTATTEKILEGDELITSATTKGTQSFSSSVHQSMKPANSSSTALPQYITKFVKSVFPGPRTSKRIKYRRNGSALPHTTETDEFSFKKRRNFAMVSFIGVGVAALCILFIIFRIKLKEAKREKQAKRTKDIENARNEEDFVIKQNSNAPIEQEVYFEDDIEGESEKVLLNKAVPMETTVHSTIENGDNGYILKGHSNTQGGTLQEIEEPSKHNLSGQHSIRPLSSSLQPKAFKEGKCPSISKICRQSSYEMVEKTRQEVQRKRAFRCNTCRQYSHEFCQLSIAVECDKKLEDLGECQKKLIREKLDMQRSGIQNWREAAQFFHVPRNTIQDWESKIKAGESPSESLIVYLMTKTVKIVDLFECLKTIKREDAYESLEEHLTKKCDLCIHEETL